MKTKNTITHNWCIKAVWAPIQPAWAAIRPAWAAIQPVWAAIQLYTNIKFTHTPLKCKEIQKYQFKATTSLGHTVSSVDCSALEAGAFSVLAFSWDVLCSGIIFWSENMSPPMSLVCTVFFATEHGLPGIGFASPHKSGSPVGGVLPVPDFFDDVLVLTILHSKFTINHQTIYFIWKQRKSIYFIWKQFTSYENNLLHSKRKHMQNHNTRNT